ncbi:MAG: hydrogenase expression/formation protein HypE [Elusimicrobiales bacterium]
MSRISIEHGSGGKLTFELIKDVFLKELGIRMNNYSFEDSWTLRRNFNKIAFTTDSYVITPLFFPGGDIGRLAVCGTVNDISVSGATPFALSAGFIIEEGFEIERLKKILDSMKKACAEAGVSIVCGDTKVVEKGKADGIFINTAGLGFFDKDYDFSYRNPRAGDAVIINGEIASHGVAVLNARHNLGLGGEIKSDVAPLNGLVDLIRGVEGVRCMKDLTRGGLATGLIEICDFCGYGFEIDEKEIPLSKSVRSACEVLGLDPLYVANEGKIIVVVDYRNAKDIVERMRKHPYGKKARIIGRVIDEKKVYIKTTAGMRRMIVPFSAEQLPRIC